MHAHDPPLDATHPSSAARGYQPGRDLLYCLGLCMVRCHAPAAPTTSYTHGMVFVSQRVYIGCLSCPCLPSLAGLASQGLLASQHGPVGWRAAADGVALLPRGSLSPHCLLSDASVSDSQPLLCVDLAENLCLDFCLGVVAGRGRVLQTSACGSRTGYSTFTSVASVVMAPSPLCLQRQSSLTVRREVMRMSCASEALRS